MGRKKMPTAELVPDAPINKQKLNEDQNVLAKMEAAFSDEQRRITFLIGKRIGRRDQGRMIAKLVTVSDVLDLQLIKESKQYKGFVHVDEAGNQKLISTWEDYCEVVEGKTARAVDLDLQNLNQLGEELFDSMRQVGLGPGKMREIRKLPDDSQAALLEAAREGDKDTLLDLAEQLIAKHSKEKDALERKIKDTEGDLEAARKLSDKYRNGKDELELEIAKLENRRQRQAPAERSKELRAAAAQDGLQLEVVLRSTLRSLAVELKKDFEDSEIDHTSFLSSIVDSLEAALEDLRDEFELTSHGDFDWMKGTQTNSPKVEGGANSDD